MIVEAEAVCENCGGVVDDPSFRFDRCEQVDGFWFHYLNGERVPRHVFGTTDGTVPVIADAAQ